MPTLSITKNYADNTTLTQAQLDSAFVSVETFVNTTKLDGTNIQAGSVASSHLAAGAVNTAALGAAAVTLPKLGSDITVQLVPTGAILPFGGTTAPAGYLLCDGSQVSRTTYAALAAALYDNSTSKYAWGAGDGATTFHLPDLRGRFLRGVDGGAARDPDRAARTVSNTSGNTGDHVGSVQADGLGTHGHGVTDPAHTHNTSTTQSTGNYANPGNKFVGGATNDAATAFINGALTSVTTGLTVNNFVGSETRPINAGVTYIIKT